MKKLTNGAWRCMGNCISHPKRSFTNLAGICLILFSGLLFTGCIKDQVDPVMDESPVTDEVTGSALQRSCGNTVNQYQGLPRLTEKQLQQARAATARYRNFNNAIRDGYEDIGVVVPNMGSHYMKSSLLNDGFDVRKPEILVYNANHSGQMELVAVEYAIHLADPRPSGFFGSSDVWDGTSGFPFWLLHAWVWTYNPSGVFNPTNPDVHLH